MEFVSSLVPGVASGLLGFGALVIIAGRFCRRRFRHDWKSVATYTVAVGLLWFGCLCGGFALFWPLLKQDGHAALAVFLIPYVIISLPVAGVALLKYGSDLLTKKSGEAHQSASPTLR